ncbi:hypothetical protein OJ996_09110 [Luteolibacter sp. GHJ8]|uniref:Uncharacterized protein n=1 Tax=Luteolibacter rhizosphaerae TaxID=2989719 RepID=A0ABT3G1L8_9BACT|nr:hypothetical protein [Luteolibacter rhizosphaerae]MCW1913732.1 hypothetical protein [Luteolibacter rhizosphaerae]
MSKFKVIDPKGIHFGGRQIKKGDTITSPSPLGAHIRTFLHFGQIEVVEEEDEAAKAEAEKGKK